MSDSAGSLTTRVGEMRRLTFMYCDVVGSTELSRVHSLEAYHDLMEGYQRACVDVIEQRFEGHIVHYKGDGVLSAFGYPVAHENDAERAVRAALALVEAVGEVRSAETGEALAIRVGVHNGTVYRKLAEDEILGFATNIGARYETLADPGTVVVSDEVRQLVEAHFELEAGAPQPVKGTPEPLQPFRVVQERHVRTPRAWMAPLIGRDGELQALRAALASGAKGALVWGEPGVGKSRLVAALTDALETVRLYGSPFHADAGLHPVRGLLERRCGLRPEATAAERLADLALEVERAGLDAAAVPLLAPVLGLEPAAGYVPAAAEGQRLEEQVNQTVQAYLKACAPVVVAEDLHWFDDATRALLARIAREGVFVVATSRRFEPGSWEAIELRPLAHDDRLALIDALALDLPAGSREALAARSDGIPLYVEELVRAGPAAVHAVTPVPGSVPAALYEPLVARLYATPDALGVAATAAAAGQVVERSLLAATTALADEQLDSTLGTLVATRILEPVDDARFRFRHELLREVAYELQPPSWRRMIHGRLGDVLLADEPGDWHVVAAHLERAERMDEAADAYLNTAEWARRRGALGEARAHLTRAIELVQDTRREVKLRLHRGMLAMSAEGAGSAAASDDLDRCRELAASDPQGDELFSTLIALWAYYLSCAELGRSREISTTLQAALPGERPFFLPQNGAGFAMLDWFEGAFEASAAGLEQATAELAALGAGDAVAAAWFVPNDPTVAMFTHLGLARFMTGDTAGAEASLAHARVVAAELDFPHGPWSSAYAIWLHSWLAIETGADERAEAELAEVVEAAEEHGFEGWAVIATTQSIALEALRDLRTGAAPETLAEHAETLALNLEVWEALGLRIFLPFYLTSTGALLAGAGDAAAARERYEQSLALAAETGMRFYDAETLRRLAALDDDPRPGLEAARELAVRQGARPFELRIALDLDRAR